MFESPPEVIAKITERWGKSVGSEMAPLPAYGPDAEALSTRICKKSARRTQQVGAISRALKTLGQL